MYPKLILKIIIFAILISKISLDMMDDEDTTDSIQHAALSRLTRMRCTRRFSPGSCNVDVAPVWTFVFLAQNCTERLGCRNTFRTNRFPSYRTCMKRCRPLVDVYLKMVEYEQEGKRNETCMKERKENENYTCKNDDYVDENQTEAYSNLRVGLRAFLFSRAPAPQFEEQEEEEEEYKAAQESQAIVYKDMNVNDQIQIPDVDYVFGEIRSELDFIHRTQ